MPRRSRFNKGLPSLDPRPHDQRCEESLTHNRALNGASPPHLLQVFGWPARCRHRNLMGKASRSRTWTQARAAARMTSAPKPPSAPAMAGSAGEACSKPSTKEPADTTKALKACTRNAFQLPPVRPTSSTTSGSGRASKGACAGPLNYELSTQYTSSEEHTYKPCPATGSG